MEVAYLEKAIEDINFWNKSGNKNIQKKIAQLIESVKETLYEGIGKPEALSTNCPANGQEGLTRKTG
jgi:toxin YoeB